MLKLSRFEHVNLINLLPCLYRLGTGELLPVSLCQFKFLFLLIPGALPHCRGVLRRTERATAREREREQEQRGRVPSSAPTVVALPHHHSFYKKPFIESTKPTGRRIQPHLCPPTYSFFDFCLSTSIPVLTTSKCVVAWPQGDQFLGGGL